MTLTAVMSLAPAPLAPGGTIGLRGETAPQEPRIYITVGSHAHLQADAFGQALVDDFDLFVGAIRPAG